MNDVTQSLLLEHDHMRKMLNIFDEQLAVFEQAEQPDYELLSDSLAYCKDYLDVWHHPREDRLLALLQERDPQKAHPLRELDGQHKALAENTLRVVQVFKDVGERGAVHLRDDLVRSGRDLSGEYRHHIRWEEANFFPAVEDSLEAADWETARREMTQAAHATDPKSVRNRYPALFAAIEAAS
ncbi:MAG TPA: hemerythrin domain-containing protein [Croceibacterium sp.]|nr:hemerythrin domain-containing protein [Croceibacterium sp.]